jgi:hypothetical protein
MTEAEIGEVVRQAIKRRFPNASQDGVDVRIVEDFDGEYILHVTVHYKTRPAPRPELITTLHDIRDALIAEGEERFVLLTNVIADERRAAAEVG